MPRIPRQLLVDPTEVGVYHCINRCVRRAFLCGRDPATGKSFEHRKEWIQNRLKFLAGQFGIDVLGFAVMSNHLHVVLRNRPDVVRDWSDREVALRWWHLFPTRRDVNESAEPVGAAEEHRDGLEPTESDLGMILNNPQKLAEIRKRLSSIPWFMRCVAEPIARQSNKEDQCTGRFWEGRYKCQPILDESALAACLAYVDLNPIRAGVAKSPETSRFTSVFERIEARREEGANAVGTVGAAGAAAAPQVPAAPATSASMASQGTRDSSRTRSGGSPGASGSPSRAGASPSQESTSPSRESAASSASVAVPASPARDQWLSPLSLAAEIAGAPAPVGRASNKGCLAMTLNDYLRLLDWTGRQVRRDKDKLQAVPADVAPILDRLQISGEGWLELIANFGRLFRRAAGRPESLKRDAEKRRVKRTEGIANSRALFA